MPGDYDDPPRTRPTVVGMPKTEEDAVPAPAGARDLAMDEILYRNTNYLLSHRTLTQDALQLLHIHFGGDVTASMTVLDPDNLVLYLNWLMRWGMTEDTLAVWQKIRKNGKPDSEIGLRFSHFLLDS